MPITTFLIIPENRCMSVGLWFIVFFQPLFSMSQEISALKEAVINVKYQNEIKALANHPVIKSAFQTIVDLEPETMQNLLMLTQIPAPPFKEEARARKFKQLLQLAGADSIWIDAAGNVIALRRGKSAKKTVVIEGHLDTVFPEGTDVTVKKRGDTLFAPGINDDTRGLTVVLALLQAMNKSGVKTEANVLFIGTTGEEGLGDLRGVKQLFADGLKIDSYISVDGEMLGPIVSRAVGSRRYRITYKGEGGHSYEAFGLVNTHNAIARAISYFVNDADTFTRTGIKATYNVGLLGGGTSVNAIPSESWMEIDLRSESAERLNGLDKLLHLSIQRSLQEENARKRMGKDLSVDIKLIGDRPTGTQDSSLPLIQRAAAACLQMGARPQLISLSTNANIPISKSIPAVTISNGGKTGGKHSLNEWWINDKGYVSIQAALLLLVSEAGLAN